MAQKHKIYNVKYAIVTLLLTLFFLGLLIGSAYFVIKLYLPNIKYSNPQFVWLLFIPIIMSIYTLYLTLKRNRVFNKYTNISQEKYKISNISPAKVLLKKVFLICFFAFITIAIIDPKIGNKKEQVKSTGLDIMVALDVSNSMMAEDLKPNRLERAKQAIIRLLKKLHGDKIGIVVFAGDAYVQLPITNDYSAAKLFLNYISPDIVPVQGTAIGRAIQTSIDSFDEKSKAGKSIIVITDGENHEDDTIELSKLAYENNIIVNFVGLGSVQGELVPKYVNGRKRGLMKDKEGNPVVSKLNEEQLIKAASAGGGIYSQASNSSLQLSSIIEEMRSVGKAERESFIYTDFENRFQLFLMIALCFLTGSMVLSVVKK